jgi:protein O-mannosyl-transferase
VPSRVQQVRDVALIVLAAGIAFCNVFANSFHLDDFYRVVSNPGIQQVHPIWRHFVDPSTSSTMSRLTQFRPLLPLTLSLNYWWGGEALAGYHAVNLAFHAGSSVLVYLLFLQLKAPRPAAVIAGLLFAVHPLGGIVVNYISGRDLAMMQTFLLASLLCYARMRNQGRDSVIGWAGTLLFATLSILSKTNAAVLPLLIAAFELLIVRVSWRARDLWLRVAVSAIVPLDFYLWTRVALRYSDLKNALGDEVGGPGYALVQTKANLIYLFNFVWPFNIRQMPLLVGPKHWVDPFVAAACLVVAGSLFLAWRVRRTNPVVAFCIVAYWILMLPESSVVPLYHVRVDYRPYPSAAFLFGAIAIVAVTVLPRAAWLAAAVAAIAALTGASIQANRTWRTEESLFTYSVRLGGDSVAYLNLAMAIPNRKDPRVKASFERSLEIAPDYVLAHINYGLLLIGLGKEDEGLSHLRESVRLAPDWPNTHYWLAAAYDILGMHGPSAEQAMVANELEPSNLFYAYESARLSQNAGRYEDSLPPLAFVLSRNENYKLALFLQAIALQHTGELDQAIASYRRFLKQQPDYAPAHFNLGYALMEKDRWSDAIQELNRTLALQPDYREAHLHLATCYEHLGDTTRAAEERRIYEARQPS